MGSEVSSPRQQPQPLILILGQNKTSNSTKRGISLHEIWTNLNKNINIVCWLLFLKRGVWIPVPKRNRMRLCGSITPHVEHTIPNLEYSSLHNNAVIPDAVYKEQGVAAQWRTKYVANC
jgi:hypothetical protein